MIERRTFIKTLAVGGLITGTLAAPLTSEAQQATNVPRIGYLTGGSVDVDKSRLAAFQQGLQELGYSEGQNIVIEQRCAEGRLDRLPELAAELVRLKVDVLVATSTPVVFAAKKAYRRIHHGRDE